MEDNSHSAMTPKPGGKHAPPARMIASAAVLLLLVGGFFAYQHFQAPTPRPAESESAQVPTEEPVDELTAAANQPAFTGSMPSRDQASARPRRPAAPTAAPPETMLPAASLYSQQLIQRLAHVDPSQEKLTQQQAAELKKGFTDLVGQGAAAVPAIRLFLEQNQDLSFDDGTESNLVGYSSVRAGLLDTLRQIGGPEATDAFIGTLRTTADPAEIALLARYLEEQAPGQHRQEVISAARETLEQAARGELQVRETGPLFQVMQNYGDANVVADLEKAIPQWQYYATMALAGLPEGQGIPTLVQRVQEPASSGKAPNTFALQMLAQMAAQHPDAASALVEQARLGQIPDRAWTKIVEGLAGDQYQFGKPAVQEDNPALPPAGLKTYHIESGNQNFYSLPFNLYGSPEHAAQRRAVVDQLLAVATKPAAVQALQNARAVLSAPAP